MKHLNYFFSFLFFALLLMNITLYDDKSSDDEKKNDIITHPNNTISVDFYRENTSHFPTAQYPLFDGTERCRDRISNKRNNVSVGSN
jgi:hypothetical protein